MTDTRYCKKCGGPLVYVPLWRWYCDSCGTTRGYEDTLPSADLTGTTSLVYFVQRVEGIGEGGGQDRVRPTKGEHQCGSNLHI